MTNAEDTLLETSSPSCDSKTLKEFTEDDVALHNTIDSSWLILGPRGERKVYDVTAFLDDHPGGPETILDVAGKDANEEFEDIGHSTDARKELAKLLIGTLKDDKVPEFSKTNAKHVASPIKRESSAIYIALSIGIVILALFLRFGIVE